MKTIKFSHDYAKIRALDDISFTRLQQVFICNRDELGELFVRYDTAHASGFYNLPKGKLIIDYVERKILSGTNWSRSKN